MTHPITDTATVAERRALAGHLREVAERIEQDRLPIDEWVQFGTHHIVRAESLGGHVAAMAELERIAEVVGGRIEHRDRHHFVSRTWGEERDGHVAYTALYIEDEAYLDQRTEIAYLVPHERQSALAGVVDLFAGLGIKAWIHQDQGAAATVSLEGEGTGPDPQVRITRPDGRRRLVAALRPGGDVRQYVRDIAAAVKTARYWRDSVEAEGGEA